jgi:hypothetical protein
MSKRFDAETLQKMLGMVSSDEERQLIIEADDPVIWAETYLNDPDTGKEKFKTKEMFKGILRDGRRDRAVRSGRQIGKCESTNTRIQLANGSCPTAGELYNNIGEGGKFTIISPDTNHFKNRKSEAIIRDNGIKSVCRITTISNYVTENTTNHPYFILRDNLPDWIEGKYVKVGDKIAICNNLLICSVPTRFSLLNPIEATEIGESIHEKLSEGIKLDDILLPIFLSSNLSIAAFIGAYWDIHGKILPAALRRYPYIHIITNTDIANSIRTLLLRLGIQSIIRNNTCTTEKKIIIVPNSLYQFSNLILSNYPGRSRILSKIKNGKYKNIPVDGDIPDIDWDIVSEVKHVGNVQTYAITVPILHTLLTDNIISHNTVHMTVDIMHTAAVNSENIILVFITEKKVMNRILEIMQKLLLNSSLKNSFRMDKSARKHSKGIAPDFDYEINVSNGSSIRFFFMSQKPDKARGQTGNHIYLDEAEYLPDKAFPVITGILKANPNIGIWASSTPLPTKIDTWFYEFSTKCALVEYEDGSEYHIPTSLEKNWPEIEKRLREVIFDDITWSTEVMAEWADIRDAVYKKENVTSSLERSFVDNIYLTYDNIYQMNQYMSANKYIGVDWNNPRNGVRIVELADMFGSVWITRNETISYNNYTQTKAVERIMELFRYNNYKIMSVDAGYGETQCELIMQKLIAMQKDPSELLNIVDSAVKDTHVIDYTSPDTGARRRQVIKIRTKTRIIGLLGIYMESILAIPREEQVKGGIVGEISNFRRKGTVRDGGFVYTENVHSLTALHYCIHGREKYITSNLSSVPVPNIIISTELNSILSRKDTNSGHGSKHITINRSNNLSRVSSLNKGRTSGLNGTRRRIL